MNETEKEQALIEEGKINPIRYVGVLPETYSKIVAYLQTRPYQEVVRLISEMAQSERQIETNG